MVCLGILHSAAVERAMLTDEDAAVDADNLASGEGGLQLGQGKGIVVGLAISGHEHGIVHDKEVCVGGRKTLRVSCQVDVIVIVDGCGHGERNQTIGGAVGLGECF